MIELLGVGVPRGGGWLLRGVCATLERGEVTVVLGGRTEERRALLDTIAGRCVPLEGRAWVGGVPLMRTTVGRIRALTGDVDAAARVGEGRSVMGNVLAPASGPWTLGRLRWLAHRGGRDAAMAALERVGLRARADEPASALSPADRLALLVARALAGQPRYLVVREPHGPAGREAVEGLLQVLRRLGRAERLGIAVSLSDADGVLAASDRVLVLGGGRLLFDGLAGDDSGAGWYEYGEHAPLLERYSRPRPSVAGAGLDR